MGSRYSGTELVRAPRHRSDECSSRDVPAGTFLGPPGAQPRSRTCDPTLVDPEFLRHAYARFDAAPQLPVDLRLDVETRTPEQMVEAVLAVPGA